MPYTTLGFEVDDPLEKIAVNNVADNHHIPTGRLLKQAVMEMYGDEIQIELENLRAGHSTQKPQARQSKCSVTQ